jgi:hypothetical protein
VYRRYIRFSTCVSLLWLFVAQSGPAFAVSPNYGVPSNAVKAEQDSFVAAVKAQSTNNKSSIIDIGTPEPGVVALIGFGLVLLGLSYGRAAAKLSNAVHPAGGRGTRQKRRYSNQT